ncbi:MAG: transglycosylase SLT domain-containing protein [Magnetococcus sp. WYHC-3]
MFPALLLATVLGRDPLLVCAVVKEAEKQGLDPYIVCALVTVESSWRIHARSNTGDSGLFQINKRWHGEHRGILQHIGKGCAILRDCILAGGGSVREGLGRYNAGTNRAVGRRYAAKVLTLAARLKAETEERQMTISTGKFSQSAHLHGHLQQLAQFTGHDLGEMKRIMKKECSFWPWEEVEIREESLWGLVTTVRTEMRPVSTMKITPDVASKAIDWCHEKAAFLGYHLREGS